MNKKFELIKNDYISLDNCTLYRIRALIDFHDVSAGDLGGYIEKEANLSQEGNAWVYDNARVFGDAKICSDAKVRDNAWVYDDAYISDNARVYGNAKVYGDTYVCDNAWVYDDAIICGQAIVRSCVHDNAKVYGDACVFGNAIICGDAVIAERGDYIVFKNSWSSGRYFTYTKSNKMWRVGCFYGTGEELVKKAYADSEKSGKRYELYVNLVREMELMENETD
ncbi:polymer-forming cytoskeletal protein [Enterococcus cecorum]|uniref:polymer-forming cytoskeletal protein n=1 Tax=Enterococcus cecorum TaxID=44008 RepID=UPI00148E74AF|nr:polymer-forming cytoskeletal protein [Enterococcus cecorum]